MKILKMQIVWNLFHTQRIHENGTQPIFIAYGELNSFRDREELNEK